MEAAGRQAPAGLLANGGGSVNVRSGVVNGGSGPAGARQAAGDEKRAVAPDGPILVKETHPG